VEPERQALCLETFGIFGRGGSSKWAATNLGQVLAHRCALLGQLLALLLQGPALLQTQLQGSQAMCGVPCAVAIFSNTMSTDKPWVMSIL
jgi:hypothetical protein